MQKPSLTTPFLAQAGKLRQAGRLAEAIAPLRQAAALEPANPDILHDLGLTLLQTGHAREAVQALRSAIAGRETFAHAHWRLGNALESLGDSEGAISSYRTALSHDPSLYGAEFRLGGLLETAGHHTHAAACYRRASARQPKPANYVTKSRALILEQRPEDAERLLRRAIAHDRTHAPAHAQLGLLLHQMGDPVAAIECCQRAVEIDPRNPDMLNNLGNMYRAQGQFEKAESVLRQAVFLSPENADFHVNLGNALIDLKRPDEAAASYRRAIAIRPGLPRAHHGLAMSQNLLGNAESAVDAYRAAIAAAPGQAALWNDLGRTLRSLGRFSEAADAFRQGLAIDPDFADAYRNLASCQQLVGGDADIAHIAALCDRPDLPVEERVIAGFTLGKLFDDANRFDEAFGAYARSNAAYRQLRAAQGERFDAEALRREVDETIASVTAASVAVPASWGNPSELPVFIVGMPRSGTSLVEQIAASHSQVFGAGELKHIGDLAAALGNDRAAWQCADVRRLSDAHIKRLQAMGGAATRVIDKLPDNVFKLGFIAALFPSARIIFCHRDPRDIGLSCFFQKFSAGQMVFSSNLFDCGIRCRETHRLIEHWHDVLPLRMLDVSYEALVADLENESRRIVAFLGLAWEPACLDFHLSQRTVTTASAWQVRQPLYERSVGRWRNYEAHLGPLLAGLSG